MGNWYLENFFFFFSKERDLVFKIYMCVLIGAIIVEFATLLDCANSMFFISKIYRLKCFENSVKKKKKKSDTTEMPL